MNQAARQQNEQDIAFLENELDEASGYTEFAAILEAIDDLPTSADAEKVRKLRKKVARQQVTVARMLAGSLKGELRRSTTERQAESAHSTIARSDLPNDLRTPLLHEADELISSLKLATVLTIRDGVALAPRGQQFADRLDAIRTCRWITLCLPALFGLLPILMVQWTTYGLGFWDATLNAYTHHWFISIMMCAFPLLVIACNSVRTQHGNGFAWRQMFTSKWYAKLTWPVFWLCVLSYQLTS